jgi:hypothetical protein
MAATRTAAERPGKELPYRINDADLPPYISFADSEQAVAEFERVIADGVRIIQTESGHAHGGGDNPWVTARRWSSPPHSFFTTSLAGSRR